MLQYILLVGGICLAGFLYSAFAMQIHNGHKKKYLEEHPDASVMIIKDCQWNPLGFNHTVSVLTDLYIIPGLTFSYCISSYNKWRSSCSNC